MSYEAKIIADSVSSVGRRLTTFEIRFPRFILAELNTHRMLSRNSASSRAIPVHKQIAAIRKDGPFMPEAFLKNKAGMQGGSELDGPTGESAAAAWVEAAAWAVVCAENLAAVGVHKQHASRLLEPFLWHTAVVSGTEWDNFWHLRCHPDAQPEFRSIAELMQTLYRTCKPDKLKRGEWHLPYITEEDRADPRFGHDIESLAMISTGRCARVSALTHDGKRDLQQDVMLGLRLMADGHMSPFEHPAQSRGNHERVGNYIGWVQFRKLIPHEHDRLKPIEITE